MRAPRPLPPRRPPLLVPRPPRGPGRHRPPHAEAEGGRRVRIHRRRESRRCPDRESTRPRRAARASPRPPRLGRQRPRPPRNGLAHPLPLVLGKARRQRPPVGPPLHHLPRDAGGDCDWAAGGRPPASPRTGARGVLARRPPRQPRHTGTTRGRQPLYAARQPTGRLRVPALPRGRTVRPRRRRRPPPRPPAGPGPRPHRLELVGRGGRRLARRVRLRALGGRRLGSRPGPPRLPAPARARRGPPGQPRTRRVPRRLHRHAVGRREQRRPARRRRPGLVRPPPHLPVLRHPRPERAQAPRPRSPGLPALDPRRPAPQRPLRRRPHSPDRPVRPRLPRCPGLGRPRPPPPGSLIPHFVRSVGSQTKLFPTP